MNIVVVIDQESWAKVNGHLFQDGMEHLGFLMASTSSGRNTLRLLVRDVIAVPDVSLDETSHGYGLSMQPRALIEILNSANSKSLLPIEVHNHFPFDDHVAFSEIDREGQDQLISFLSHMEPNREYGALVLGGGVFDGRLWKPVSQKANKINEIQVIGPNLLRVNNSDSLNMVEVKEPHTTDNDLFQRQILALGEEGQRKLRETSVGIVGVGGVGSVVCQELAYLGVNSYVVVDDDTVDRTNLNRLPGGFKSDVGKLKVDIAKRHIRKINPGSRILAIPENIRSREAFDVLKSVDVLFGCVDTDSGRMILNELALSVMIPLIDVGVGITAAQGAITNAGGRVAVITPSRPCLICCGQINTRVAAEELESSQEQEFRREHGYVEGDNIPEPAVISLNSTLASMAITEFLALITGFRQTKEFVLYDMLEQTMPRLLVRKSNGCVACTLSGLGDGANVIRYSRGELPADIPNPQLGIDAP